MTDVVNPMDLNGIVSELCEAEDKIDIDASTYQKILFYFIQRCPSLWVKYEPEKRFKLHTPTWLSGDWEEIETSNFNFGIVNKFLIVFGKFNRLYCIIEESINETDEALKSDDPSEFFINECSQDLVIKYFQDVSFCEKILTKLSDECFNFIEEVDA